MEETTRPASPAPSYKLYRIADISLAIFLGSPLAGGILLRHNYACNGNRKKGSVLLAVSALITLAIDAAIFLMPANIIDRIPNLLIPLIYTTILFPVVDALQRKSNEAHAAAEGAFYSTWRSLGISLVVALVTFLLLMSIVLLIPEQYL